MEYQVTEPVLFNKDLGRPLTVKPNTFPQTNADGQPILPLTTEQKYIFDARGWLMIPNVLSADDIEEMQEFCERLRHNRESIPAPERSTYGGPLQRLMDHPVVVGFANEFLASPYLSSEECYGFRMEMSFSAFRSASDEPPTAFSPHNGNAMWRMPGDCHEYHCLPGKAFAGLTRVIWELNEVKVGDGGTLFITGSHKSAFTAPESALNDQSPSVRLQSALALAQLGDARMIDPLLVALRDSDARVRMLAANALGRFSNEKSVIKALQKALQDVDWKVRGVAAFTLGQIADVETIVSLEASELKETNPHVQNTIMSSLSHTKARNFQFLGLTGQEGLILAEEACALQPDNVLFQATLGWILYRQKRYPQAIETLEKTTDLESDLAGAYYYLGLSCLGLNQTLPGLNNLKTAFRLDRAYLQRAKTEPLTRGIRDQLNLSAIEPVRGN